MKKDNSDVSPRQKKLQAPIRWCSAEGSGNNGHGKDEASRVCNEVKAEVSGKPTVSLRRIESNQRNSRKSTGPTTPTGKKRVSQNAVRHGFFSKWLLIQHRDGKESQNEFDDFYAAFTNTTSRSAGSKNSGWNRSPCGLGGFVGSSVVRAVRLVELLPDTVTSSSNRGQKI